MSAVHPNAAGASRAGGWHRAGTAAPLVQARDLAKTFDVSAPWLNRVLERKPRQLLHAVDGVSFDIEKGQTLALVGESGCGKSTVARLLVGLYEPTRGDLVFDGIEDAHAAFKSRDGRKLRRRIQMIFQDPYASLNPRWKVEDIVGEPLREHGILTDAGAAEGARRRSCCKSVGLSPLDMVEVPAPVLRRPAPAHLDRAGAGHRARVPGVRRADLGARRVGAGAGAQHHEGPAAQAGPDLPVHLAQPGRGAPRVSDQVGVMYLGRLVELAGKHQLFGQPRHPYTRMLLDAIPKMHDTGRARTPVQGEVPNPLNPPTGCAFNPRCPHANERCRVERPALLTIGGVQVACHAVEEGRI